MRNFNQMIDDKRNQDIHDYCEPIDKEEIKEVEEREEQILYSFYFPLKTYEKLSEINEFLGQDMSDSDILRNLIEMEYERVIRGKVR